ncbi:hypothetical protein [Silvibacterium sp.]|uniref:hypothetical protein n=1 Tax=Silvibacterium sp. TaxID=1964179 RepID=UPI0039E246EF
MIRAAVLAVLAASICTALPAQSQSAQAQPKHYRLTFVLSYPEGKQAPQIFTLDVPVSPEHGGMAQSSTASGLTEEPQTVVQQTLQCMEVRESAKGVAANVSFTMDSVTPAPTGSSEPRHHNLTFQRQVDVALNQPTRITNEMHIRPLKPGDPVPKETAPAPQITLTATEI